MSLATKAGEGFYIPVAHRYLGAPKQLSVEVVREIVGPLLADPSVKKVAHHLKYDEIVLRRNGMAIGGDVFDTMIASYLLDPETTNGLKDVARRELGVTMTTYDQVYEQATRSQLASTRCRSIAQPTTRRRTQICRSRSSNAIRRASMKRGSAI